MIADQFRTTFAALETAFDDALPAALRRRLRAAVADRPGGPRRRPAIEIVARPPGKKAQALAMLSGGERALTAVALLFAMLEVRPVPFCVLDEVDAALDEANVGRFADALRSLAAPDPVHRHHPQPGHDRGRRRALRRDRRRRLGQPRDQPPARRGAGARRARSGRAGRGRVAFARCLLATQPTTNRPTPEVDEPVDPTLVDPDWEPDPADFGVLDDGTPVEPLPEHGARPAIRGRTAVGDVDRHPAPRRRVEPAPAPTWAEPVREPTPPPELADRGRARARPRADARRLHVAPARRPRRRGPARRRRGTRSRRR